MSSGRRLTSNTCLPWILCGTLLLLVACSTTRRPPSDPASLTSDAAYGKTVLVRGDSGALTAPGGVAVLRHADGGESVFVADSSGLHEFDASTGGLRAEVAGLAATGAVAPDASRLVVSSPSDARVQVWDAVARRVVEDHADVGVPVNALRFSGDLIITDQRSRSIARKRPAIAGATTLVAGMRFPAGLAATDRALWVTDRTSGTVLQIVRDGRVLHEPVTVATGLLQPEGLAAALDGTLFVVESGRQRLLQIAPHTRRVRVLDAQLPVGSDSASRTEATGVFNGVAVGACGAIYVTAERSNELWRFSPQGASRCGAE